MKHKKSMQSLVFLSILMLLTEYCFGQSAKKIFPEKTDTLPNIVFHFRFDKAVFDNGYMDNGKSLFGLDKTIGDHSVIENLDSIVIVGSSSPDGAPDYNYVLAQKRAEAIRTYIIWRYPKIDRCKIRAYSIGENWQGLKELVVSDKNVPYRYRILSILDQNISSGTKVWRLQQIDGGRAYKYMLENIFQYLRSSTVSVSLYINSNPKSRDTPIETEQATKPDTVKVQPILDECITDNAIQVFTPETIPDINQHHPMYIAVKSNLLSLAAGVANIGIEVRAGERFSIDMPIYYSPYTIKRDWNLRVLMFQPELRYWLNSSQRGHFFGVHAVVGWYNIAFDKQKRYQDADGNSPLYGTGLSYGYATSLGTNWGVEFTLGLGYLYVNYDVFYNVKNGAWLYNKKYHYWGPTKLGVSVFYKFNRQHYR